MAGISRVVLAVLMAFGLCGALPGTVAAGDGADLAAKLIEAWNTNDGETIDAIFAQECVYEDTNGRQFEGREGAKTYIAHIHQWADSVTVETRSIASMGATAVVEWQFGGLQVAPVGFIQVSTGRHFSIRGVTVLESVGGLITRASDYVDIATFLVQLGVDCSVIAGGE